ncbi:P-loop containing nucleoside triphosphate hydrolase protein [Mycena vulgaris]|nr:P-loop containing nucleoside triphosphate hydrolase protein [Mycena vulgaris]
MSCDISMVFPTSPSRAEAAKRPKLGSHPFSHRASGHPDGIQADTSETGTLDSVGPSFCIRRRLQFIQKPLAQLEKLFNYSQEGRRKNAHALRNCNPYEEDIKIFDDRIREIQAAIAFKPSESITSSPSGDIVHFFFPFSINPVAPVRHPPPTFPRHRATHLSAVPTAMITPMQIINDVAQSEDQYESLEAANLHFEEVLQRVFQIHRFRTGQLEVITESTVGQSLYYQRPAVFQSEQTKGGAVTVVVSPLVSLIHDQVNALKSRGVDAEYLTEETKRNLVEQPLRSDRKPALLYVTPEKLQKSGLRCLGMDEVHCISTWGLKFRDAYRKLHTLRDDFPNVPIMAFTATASRKTIDSIVSCLKLSPKEASTVVESFKPAIAGNESNLRPAVTGGISV